MAKKRTARKPVESSIRRIVRANMRNRRISLKVSQKGLGEAVGVSQAFISALESPNRPEDVPSLELLAEIAVALQTTVAALTTEGTFGGEVDPDADLRHLWFRTERY